MIIQKILARLKACYFKKVGLVDLTSYHGNIKFEFLVIKFKFYIYIEYFAESERFSIIVY